jgi:hypothetical protein
MTATARYERNHVRLGGFHIVMAAAWILFWGGAVLLDRSSLTGPGRIAVPLVGLLLVLFHAALAWGAMAKSEIARKISVVLGVAMFMWLPGMRANPAPYFPFPAYIAILLLPLTQWKTSPSPATFPQSSAAN